MATDTTGWTREQVLEARKFYALGFMHDRTGTPYALRAYALREAYKHARREFPMPLVTVPREMKTTTVFNKAIWYRILDGQLQYHLEYEDEDWHDSSALLVISCSPSELEVIAELKRNPTATREIE